MKAIKRIIISLVVIVAVLGVVVIGGYIYVRSAYGIDLFRTAGQLKTLTEQVNETELCPNTYGDSDFVDLKNSVNAEIEGLVKFEVGKGYNGYTLDFNALIGAELSKTIALSEKQVGALAVSFETFVAPASRRYVELTADELSYFNAKAGLITMIMRRGETGYVALICAMIAQIISILCATGVKELGEYPDWFKALLEKIHAPENIACRAKDVYAMGSFSPPVMVDYFKRYTGKTVAGYLKEMKCDYAKEWLAETDMSTLEIAGLLGYDSLSHFNRIFKEYVSMPPAKFRRSIRNADNRGK